MLLNCWPLNFHRENYGTFHPFNIWNTMVTVAEYWKLMEKKKENCIQTHRRMQQKNIWSNIKVNIKIKPTSSLIVCFCVCKLRSPLFELYRSVVHSTILYLLLHDERSNSMNESIEIWNVIRSFYVIYGGWVNTHFLLLQSSYRSMSCKSKCVSFQLKKKTSKEFTYGGIMCRQRKLCKCYMDRAWIWFLLSQSNIIDFVDISIPHITLIYKVRTQCSLLLRKGKSSFECKTVNTT